MNDEFDRSDCGFGRRAAARNVERGRRIYERFAETAERSTNVAGASASRTRARLHAVVFAPRGYDRFEAHAIRHWQGLREIGMRLVIAADTNVRAGFDCAERLTQACDVKDVLAVQAAFLRQQARRSAEQAIDLQRVMVDVAKRSARLA